MENEEREICKIHKEGTRKWKVLHMTPPQVEELRQVAKAKERTQVEKGGSRKRLCKNVGNVVGSRDIGEVNVGIIDAFTNVVPVGIDMFSVGVKTRVFCESKGSVIIRQERSGVWLWYIDLSSKHSQPHAFVGCLTTGNVLSVASGLSDSFMFAQGPRDYTGSKREAVSTDRLTGVGTAHITGIKEPQELGWVLTT